MVKIQVFRKIENEYSKWEQVEEIKALPVMPHVGELIQYNELNTLKVIAVIHNSTGSFSETDVVGEIYTTDVGERHEYLSSLL
jgi:hypothetical protein